MLAHATGRKQNRLNSNFVRFTWNYKFDKNVWHAWHHRLKTGSADLKATASAADPS